MVLSISSTAIDRPYRGPTEIPMVRYEETIGLLGMNGVRVSRLPVHYRKKSQLQEDSDILDPTISVPERV